MPLGVLSFPNENLPRKDVAFSFAFDMISARKFEVFTGGAVVIGLSIDVWWIDEVVEKFEDGFGIGFGRGGRRGGRDVLSGETGGIHGRFGWGLGWKDGPAWFFYFFPYPSKQL